MIDFNGSINLEEEARRRQRILQLTREILFIRGQLTKVYLSVIQQQNERMDLRGTPATI